MRDWYSCLQSQPLTRPFLSSLTSNFATRRVVLPTGMKTAALLVALVAIAATADAQTTISGGTGRSSYEAATAVTTQLELSTGAKAVKDALATSNWATAKTAYDTNLKATADLDRSGDPVFDAFKAAYGGSATFITDYFNKAQVSVMYFCTAAAGRTAAEPFSPLHANTKPQTPKSLLDYVTSDYFIYLRRYLRRYKCLIGKSCIFFRLNVLFHR